VTDSGCGELSGLLDKNVSEAIRQDVFESWLDAEIAAANVEWTILREA